jgi:hypothetical protein
MWEIKRLAGNGFTDRQAFGAGEDARLEALGMALEMAEDFPGTEWWITVDCKLQRVIVR